MGVSLSAAAAIIGVSILVVTEVTVGTLLPAVTDICESYVKMRDRSVEQLQTDISIVSASTTVNGSNYDLNFTVNNTGSITLAIAFFNVLINGTNHVFSCPDSYLYPGDQTYFVVTNLSGTGSKKLKVVTDNGISDYYVYRAP